MAFALKDFKLMLNFCEVRGDAVFKITTTQNSGAMVQHAQVNLHLFFSGAGHPLIMSSANIDDLGLDWILNVVVATFASDDECEAVNSEAAVSVPTMSPKDRAPSPSGTTTTLISSDADSVPPDDDVASSVVKKSNS